MNAKDFALIFLTIGGRSFGGWSTTALLLEYELVTKRKVATKTQLNGAVAYAQMLPGATQVAIVANLGYRLRGIRGALISTTAYLLPALSLITIFGFVYFHYISGTQIMHHMGGLLAALAGIILANAYRIGKRHATHWLLWGVIVLAGIARLWWGINVLVIIVSFGLIGLACSWWLKRKQM
jgi:chromate transporter